jgi:hypothetical protein
MTAFARCMVAAKSFALIACTASIASATEPRAGPRLPDTQRIADEPAAPWKRAPVTIRVGIAGDVRTVAEAARIARDGDTVEVEAGVYRGDVAVWLQKRLTLRAVGGRARMVADGMAAEGKGIWVIRDGTFDVEGFDFEDARVSDLNGAGIRFEHGKLTVRDSRFLGNENGILTSNDGRSELVIERCSFSGNGHGDGQSHNLYVGRIERLVVTASYFRAAQVGHLLKSRARVSEVLFNRLTDEEGGRASYELEFPSGGIVTVIGNLVEQGPATENPTVVSFGAEGYGWPENSLSFVHNTVVNRRTPGGVFVRVRAGEARALLANNVFVGRGSLAIDVPAEEVGNAFATIDQFVQPEQYDYRPVPRARFAGGAASLDRDELRAFRPTQQYAHERRLVPLDPNAATTPGAFQPER